MPALLNSNVLFTLACAVAVAYVGRFLSIGYRRRQIRRGKPGPPHSMIWGDLRTMGEVAAAHPTRVHPHVYSSWIRKKYPLRPFVFLDLWPVSDPLVAVLDPDVCNQVTLEHHADKHHVLARFLEPLVGANDMVSSNGEMWKKWRNIFNPGFSTAHLMTLVPGIVDDVSIYVEKLEKYAEKNTIFRLEEETTRLTIDIIGKVSLDLHFNMQRGENECIAALREQVHYLPNQPYDLLTRFNPWGFYKRWSNDRIMRQYIGKVVDERFASKAAVSKDRSRTILDLALDTYLSGETSDGDDAPPPVMDAAFREGVITQIRLFLFAGHDTTSSTICYALYLLRKHPSCLRRIRAEHDAVLGPVAHAAARLRAAPHLLHRLEYTLCVIKETLRLFPPASSSRQGARGLVLRDPVTGDSFDTEGWMVWVEHYGLGRNPDVWGPHADRFVPDRFLPEHLHRIPDGAWRPFELGPRNCIGQNLAVIEARVTLALTCRSLEFDAALDPADLEEVGRDGSFYARDEGFRKGAVHEVAGEPLYQVLIGAAKPREGMPCRVRKVDWSPLNAADSEGEGVIPTAS